MKKSNNAKLIDGNINKTLIGLTIPMLFGMMGMVAFNLVDTFFIGKLGINELAALSFTFPVVLIISSIALGLGAGTSAVISRAIGEGDHHRVQRLTTDSLSLSLLIVAVFSCIGFFTIDQTFKLLGATESTLPLIKQYMQIWYLGMIFVVVPMVGNNAIRATGDTKTPSAVMIFAVLINGILDPLLIFGIGPFPKLGITGAALATVFARMTTFVVSILILGLREKMITLKLPGLKLLWDSWKNILFIGVPTAATRVIIPVSAGIITRIISSYGNEAVAGYGVATKVEFFAISFLVALSVVIGPFIGQNWGAKKYDRVVKGLKKSKIYSLYWGVFVFIIFAIFAKQIAGIFNKNENVILITSLYLRVVSIGYGIQGIFLISATAMNFLNKPLHAAILTIIQMFIIYIPLSFIGSYLFKIPGIFGALLIAYVLGGILAHYTINYLVNSNSNPIVESS